MRRGGRRRPGAREGGQQGHLAVQLELAGRSHFAEHEDPLAAVVLDRDSDLWIPQVAVGELRPELLFEVPQRQPPGLDAPDLRKGEGAVLLHGVFPGELPSPKTVTFNTSCGPTT
ncbi:MAG: hypothetical protein QM736_02890 [Vicinamibacterales bacterium]